MKTIIPTLFRFWVTSFCFIIIFSAHQIFAQQNQASSSPDAGADAAALTKNEFDQCFEVFKEVYATMQKNYYHPVELDNFKKFVYVFGKTIYPQLKAEQKSEDYIRWRSAAYLVEFLRDKEDIFSAFYPPKEADKYERTALGQRVDLGIDGELTERGFRVTWIEPRSDAYEKGMREQDVIWRIGGSNVLALSDSEVRELLNPLAGTKVMLRYWEHDTNQKKKISVESKEYFKKLAFLRPTGVEGIFCIQIERFNRATAEDMTEYIKQIVSYPGQTGLIIDLRGNPGGPPLAAREISAFFLEPASQFAYFERRGSPKSWLDVPVIPPEYHYTGDIVILINQGSGSASELFSGILQGKGRAALMGKNSAGQVFLKSMFYMKDGSMVLLVTARGHHPNGDVFPFSGLNPDVRVENNDEDLIRQAAEYLLEKRGKSSAQDS